MTGDPDYQKVPFILAHTTIDFRSPGYVHETLEIGIRVSKIGTKSFECEYRIEEQATRRLVCEGRSVMVIYDYAKLASMRMPDALRAQFRAFEGRAEL